MPHPTLTTPHHAGDDDAPRPPRDAGRTPIRMPPRDFFGGIVNRADATVLLLRTMDEWVPSPRGVSLQRGESRDAWQTCPGCGGRRRVGPGRTLRRGVRRFRVCERCAGEGSLRVDPMTADAKQGHERAEDRRAQQRRRERELRRLEREQAHREGRVEPDEREGWEAAREWLERRGSYRELRILVAALPELERRALQVVHGSDRELRLVSAELRVAVDAIVERLSEQMPVPIRVPAVYLRDERDAKTAVWRGRSPNAGKQRASRDERLLAVVRLRGQRAAAVEFDLSERQVRRIVRSFEATEQVGAS